MSSEATPGLFAEVAKEEAHAKKPVGEERRRIEEQMLIIPAIDIKDGKVVRLTRGDYRDSKVYSTSPLAVAKRWESYGARLLHIVDLDAALSGRLKNLGKINDIIQGVNIPIQVGGGIRNEETVIKVLSKGVHRIILGTAACEDENFVAQMLKKYGEKVQVSIDARDGIVATDGWTKSADIKATDLIKRLEMQGMRVVIYTDISRDGTLAGPNIDSIKEVLACRDSILVIASGGISSLEDLIKLKELESKGLFGIIIGKALYEKKIDLAEAIRTC